MKKYCLVILFFLMTSVSVANVGVSAKDAAFYFKENQFEKARTSYELLLEQYPNNSDILYNLGNTYFKLDQKGLAIGYYLKALKLDPFKNNARYNLNLINESLNQKKQEKVENIIVNSLNYFTLNNSFYIMIIILLVTLSLIRIRQKTKKHKELLNNGAILGIVLTVMTLSLFSYKQAINNQQVATVIVKKIEVHSGPSASLPTLFYMHDGVTCKVKTLTTEWAEVQLKNGLDGWVKLEALFLI